jgi:arylsulfatase A-like enzyme
MGGSFVRLVRSHLDGYNLLPYLTGQEEESPRKEAFYFSDDGDLTAVRYQDWKAVFMEQKTSGTSCKRSRSSLHGKRQPASRLTRPWRS